MPPEGAEHQGVLIMADVRSAGQAGNIVNLTVMHYHSYFRQNCHHSAYLMHQVTDAEFDI